MNRAEKDGLRALRDSLPENYIVLGNFELHVPNRRNTLEFDAVVIGDWGVYTVEIKGWSGKIKGDVRRWTMRWGKVESPFVRIETKAKALRDVLVRRVEGWPDALFCESVVYLSAKKVSVKVDDARCEKLIRNKDIPDYFVDRAMVQHPTGPQVVHVDDALKQHILDVLLPISGARQESFTVPGYHIHEELEPLGREYREFKGRHEFLRSRGAVRIKSYTLDPLIEPSQREQKIQEVLRDIQALEVLSQNPYIARAYDALPSLIEEIRFDVIVEWVGRRTLRGWMEATQEQQVDPGLRWTFAKHIVKAVASMHEEGVVHRNLHPEVFRLTESKHALVPFKVADFDFATMERLQAYGGAMRSFVKHGYGAPELWIEEEPADWRAEMFAVGAIVFEVLTGRAFYEESMALLRLQEIWGVQQRHLPDDETREALGKLLAYLPQDRGASLYEVLPFFEARSPQPWPEKSLEEASSEML